MGEGQATSDGRVTARELYALIQRVEERQECRDAEILRRMSSVETAMVGLPCNVREERLKVLEKGANKHEQDIEGLKKESRMVGAINAAGALIAGALGIRP